MLLLSQAEADALIAMPKRPSVTMVEQFPGPGERLVISLVSLDRSEDFLLDVTRNRIDFSKVTYQNRAQVAIVLLRLDLNGPPHRNPDERSVPCPHLHIYKEGYGDKWAYPLPQAQFKNQDDIVQTFSDFMVHCNVVEQLSLQTGLF